MMLSSNVRGLYFLDEEGSACSHLFDLNFPVSGTVVAQVMVIQYADLGGAGHAFDGVQGLSVHQISALNWLFVQILTADKGQGAAVLLQEILDIEVQAEGQHGRGGWVDADESQALRQWHQNPPVHGSGSLPCFYCNARMRELGIEDLWKCKLSDNLFGSIIELIVRQINRHQK